MQFLPLSDFDEQIVSGNMDAAVATVTNVDPDCRTGRHWTARPSSTAPMSRKYCTTMDGMR